MGFSSPYVDHKKHGIYPGLFFKPLGVSDKKGSKPLYFCYPQKQLKTHNCDDSFAVYLCLYLYLCVISLLKRHPVPYIAALHAGPLR